MKPGEENITSSATHLRTPLKAGIRREPINLSASTLMTYSKTLTSTARTGTPVTGDTLMSTPGPTRIHRADTRDTFKEALEQVSLMTCLKTSRECLLLTDTPNRLTTGFTVHQNNIAEQ